MVVTHHRRRWFGHVECKPDDDWVKKYQQLVAGGKAGRERDRKTWIDHVRRGMKELGLRVDDAREEQNWKGKSLAKRLSQCKQIRH